MASSPASAAASGRNSTSSTLVRKQFHYGMVDVSDGKCRPQPARLKVCPEYLVLQREEIIFPDDDDEYPIDNKLRTVRLKRGPDGSLGISIKGGRDHNLPILVSKVCHKEEDDNGEHVYIGDAIVRVNHSSLSSVSHDEAINVLRNAGPEVVMTVKHYRSAAPFLLRNLTQFIPEECASVTSASSSSTAGREQRSDRRGSKTKDPNRNTTASSLISSSSSTPQDQHHPSDITPVTTTTAAATSSACAITCTVRGPFGAAMSASKPGHGGVPLPLEVESVTSPPPIGSPSPSGCSVASSSSNASHINNWNGVMPRVRRKWVDVIEVPLMMAYMTRYIFGTDRIRPNSFEVRGMNGSSTGVIHSSDLAVLSHWIKLISDYITALTSLKGAQFNRLFSAGEQISYMSWVAEGVLNQNQPWQNWKPKFFALRGADMCIFEKPPLDQSDWLAVTTPQSPPNGSAAKNQQGQNPAVDKGPETGRCQVQVCPVYEAMFRVIKESENVDERQHCFLIQTAAGGESRYFSMETRAELLRLESAWHRAVCSTISQLGSKTFHVVYRNLPAAFTIDWTDGFLLRPFAAPTYHFVYSFSQLKGSSDDGHATLTLQFVEYPKDTCNGKDRGTQAQGNVVEQSLISPKLQNLLFYMHAFLTAKVASMDPTFLSRGRLS